MCWNYRATYLSAEHIKKFVCVNGLTLPWRLNCCRKECTEALPWLLFAKFSNMSPPFTNAHACCSLTLLKGLPNGLNFILDEGSYFFSKETDGQVDYLNTLK
jgi:hypothetical protein